MAYLIQLDIELFKLIHQKWTNSFFDLFMPFLTDLNRQWWIIPVTLILLSPWFYIKKIPAVKIFLALIVVVAVTDIISYRIIKTSIDRKRPIFQGIEVNLKTHNHYGPAFPSNHAANAFTAATFITFVYPCAWPTFILASLIAYSRVYVGVHFPLDILGGALWGFFCGWLGYLLFAKAMGGQITKKHYLKRRFGAKL